MQKQLIVRIILFVFMALLAVSSLVPSALLAETGNPGAGVPVDSIPPVEAESADPEDPTVGLIETLIIVLQIL